MSSVSYVKELVFEMDGLVRGVLTGSKNLEKENPKYEVLRRRLLSLQPLTGAVPDFIEKSSDLWKLWNVYVKGVLPSYESRREFLNDKFVAYYDQQLQKIGGGDFQEELLRRDIALLDEVGSGGFGVVYSADHIVLQERRAVKKLEPVFADAKDSVNALRRFSREATILYKVAHPGIVRVFDAGMAGTYPYIIMEFVEGSNLGKLVAEYGPFDPASAKEIMTQVTDAIACAHAKDVIHRDLKPSNIMWNGARAVVLDFGAGQWVEHSLSTRMTTALVGTVGYVADELQSAPTLLAKNLDCYSLGVVYHFLLTGRTPNAGDPTFYMKSHGVEQAVQEIILRAMGPASHRYADGSELLHAIRS